MKSISKYFLFSFFCLFSTFSFALQQSDFSKIYHAEPSFLFYPTSTKEVQEIILKALEEGKKIAVAGSSMSQGGHTLPSTNNSFSIKTNLLNQITINPEQKSAKVGSGVTWKELQDAAYEHNLAIKVMQASNIFSVGGSLSTNVHGWDHKEGALVETIRSITIVDASGNIQTLKPNDELFSLIIGGYGMFGIIVEAEIDLADDLIVERKGTLISTVSYADYFAEIEKDPSVVLHYGRLLIDPMHLFENVIAVNYTKTTKTYKKPKALPTEPQQGHWYERIAIQMLRKYPYLIIAKQTYDNRVFLKPKLMSRNEAMLPNIRFICDDNNDKHADMLQEFFIPKQHLNAFLAELRSQIELYDIHLFNATIRHVKQDHLSALPYAKTDVFAVVLYYNEMLDADNIAKIEEFTKGSVASALRFEGTYYLPYHCFPTLEQFHQAYPEYLYIKDKRKEYDPLQLFSSQFSQHYLD